MNIREFLNKIVYVKIDRKLGSAHPKHGIKIKSTISLVDFFLAFHANLESFA